jgi:hypothetical protein
MSQEDRAQDEEVFQWEMLNRPRTPAPVFKPGEDGYGPALCANPECEDDLPDLRRAMGKRFCTECQGLAEQRAKRGY